jgi:hypothetical protein
MSDVNASRVNKNRQEFRLVAPGLGPLLLLAMILAASQLGCRAHWWDGGKSGDSPILVRGGSMTAYTIAPGAPGGWGPPLGPSSKPSYCISVDTSYIEFDNGSDGTSKHVPNLTAQWVLYIYGHALTDYSSTATPSSNGLEFDANSINCQGTPSPGKTFLHLSSILPGPVYPRMANAVTKRTGNVRFRDVSPSSDEDFAERMALVVVKSDTNVQLAQYTCIDGDCSVVIGKPQP